ncbi:hypothetical protein B0H19DRAFT_1069525 [Mycena capillaripes]|nr:hypothetical protein B0H19DRAFT_1069525 [Mycena capillaripes]
MSLKFPFTATTRRYIQDRYYFRCSVCLQAVIAGQCAHLFARAAEGQKEVDEAVALGILDSETAYDRKNALNGTLQCPTCHLEYFTKGLLVWSPPMEVLQWIVDQMSGKGETQEMREIFSALDSYENSAEFDYPSESPDFPQELRHLINHYSLIPIFKPNSRILVDGEFQRDPPPLDGEPTYRIFDCNDAHMRTTFVSGTASILTFYSSRDQDDVSPINYWHFPAPCNAILYLFLRQAEEVEDITEFTRPEILLAQKIYRDLKEISFEAKGNPDRGEIESVKGTNFALASVAELLISLKPHSHSAKSVSAARSHSPKPETDYHKCRPTAKHICSEPLAVPAESPSRGGSSPIHRAKSDPVVRTPTPRKGGCGIHDDKGHRKHYCSTCYITVPRPTPIPLDYGVKEDAKSAKCIKPEPVELLRQLFDSSW